MGPRQVGKPQRADRSDPAAGTVSGPVVVRPIYNDGIYEEIKYRQKDNVDHASLHRRHTRYWKVLYSAIPRQGNHQGRQ